jgi:two-component system, OmpR family, sensor kinase
MKGDQLMAPIPLAGPNEIRSAAEALNDMQSRIVRYVRERTTLTGAIAHDLRTPLSRINFRLASAPPELRASIEQDVREMEQMLEVTLDFLENEIRPLASEPIDLAMLIEGVVENFSDVGRDAQLVSSEPATIMGDPLLLKRALSNLVENALKYGQAARVELSLIKSRANITISDKGKGMTADELSRAFEPFYRGEPSRNHKTGGVGLGLSIVKSTVEAHNGLVTLANGPANGLVVTVVLPIETEG